MKKRLLFIAPDYYGFSQVVFDGLKKYSGYEVIYLDSSPKKYLYKNFRERIYNFFLKTFCGKNLKIIKRGKHIKRTILQENYDILLIIGAYELSKENLDLALGKAPYSVTIFWDSIEKIPMQKDQIGQFDTCYSFDKEDCQKYGLKEITNFYFIEQKNNNTFDVAYLATYDQRINETITIFNYFKNNKINAKAKYFSYPSHPIKEKLPENIEIIRKIIPFKESYQYYLDSKVILDIAHPHQRGLSFRPFEAMGMHKKLITTNKNIVNYDFYNPNNIFVIENTENFSIPKSFFETDYQEVPSEIKEKYHIKSWVKKVFSEFNQNIK